MRALGCAWTYPAGTSVGEAWADVTDWLLTRAERDNDAARVDGSHPDRAWSEGNLCGR